MTTPLQKCIILFLARKKMTEICLPFNGLKGDSNASDIVCKATIQAKKRGIFLVIFTTLIIT